jgi:hypothetical protein
MVGGAVEVGGMARVRTAVGLAIGVAVGVAVGVGNRQVDKGWTPTP